MDNTIVMWRDASFVNNPGRASKYHKVHPTEVGPVALCNSRMLLDDEHTSTVSNAGILMCKRCAKIKQ